ncbi:phosphatase PAP2 family protein [Shewanella surugensis]|uniref:undecaprenyl-diphosphate phosphatase n=1 Tax=Shewanella surugensis TaxID=212020 RepID=A0ABT0LEL0_9GAMM|nr:phosphatase PAP2 family protein [Shewanella surugensis]MCL1126128.1 phosphatase PAP2 family protein [Shewanella surugensis]
MFETISKLDKYAFSKVNKLAYRYQLIKTATKISFTGDGPLYLYFMLALQLFHPKGEAFFNLAGAGLLLAFPLYFILKNTSRRARPCHGDEFIAIHFEPSDKFSLPSGHTTAAFVMATSIGYIFPQWTLLAYSWALCIGCSRIILGVHYPFDILAGGILGVESVNLMHSLI